MIDPNSDITQKINLDGVNYKLYNIAIHNNNRKKNFYLNNFFQSSGSSLNKITVNDNLWNFSRKLLSLNFFIKRNYSKVEVQCQTLDKFTKNNSINKIDILKFDTEGNELNILKGAKKILKNTGLIYFEILSNKSHYQYKFNTINNILQKNNFFLYKKKKIITVSFLSNLVAYDLVYLKISDYKSIIK